MNCVYIVRCSDHTYYTGWTNALEKRLKVHNMGKGAKYTRGRIPIELIYHEQFETKNEAMKREAEIKKMTRVQKEKLMKLV
ncbi:GIY-YIG nuclease family protein [Lutibacter sp. B2]|nr:GIY-YIG nuclease family protein [Lutibacter sp. B2]